MSVRIVSLFCGVGGSDMGLYAAARSLGIDVQVVAAYDSDAKAVEIYNKNLPHPSAVVADVKQMYRDDLPPHDLVIGGPPCQPYSLAGKRRGSADERDCLADFMRLVGDGPWLMENVVPRLLPQAPFSVKLNAFDFGDVTTRKRWFYSTHLLHVIETPGPLRFGDIRDHEADRVAIDKRVAYDERRFGAKFGIGDEDVPGTVCANTMLGGGGTMVGPPTRKKGDTWHGRDVRSKMKLVGIEHETADMTDAVARKREVEEARQGRRYGMPERRDDEAIGSLGASSSWRLQSGSTLVTVGQRSYPLSFTEIGEGGVLGSVTSHTHDQPLRAGQSRPTQDDDALGTLTVGKGGVSGFLKVGLRGHSASASASAFEDDDPLGSIPANSWHGNELSKLGPSVRCPSLLEMQRAHSFPDSFDWCGATKTQRGKCIANSWPCKLSEAVCRAMLVAIGAA